MTRLRRIWRALVSPFVAEERAAAAAAWDALPAAARTPGQCLGRWSTGCGATWGVMERCDFACTACYLAAGANATPPLPFDAVRGQIDALRAHLGPGGRIQITAGEVTLLPAPELVRIVRHARERGLVPMVMTHGQRFAREPHYLERLVREGGLDRISIHVDTTQRGRDGGDPEHEAELHAVRDRMAALVRDVRRRTRRRLVAAHTVTVGRGNLAAVPDVVRWVVRNADAFRMLSFQPVAEVGRTRETSHPGRRDALWARIAEGLGCAVDPGAWQLGHPDCNQFVFAWVVRSGDRFTLVPVNRPGSRLDRRLVRRLLTGGLAGFTFHGEPRPIGLARLAGRLLRDPLLLLELPLYAVVRAAGEWRLALRLLGGLLRGRRPGLAPLCVVVHHFMDAGELATARGQERLAACTFKVPYAGRMVSMCEFNGAGLRAASYTTSRRMAPEAKPEPNATSISSREPPFVSNRPRLSE